MRRAQMEMVGLVFIVVLLVMGFVLYLRFSISGDSGTKEESSMQGATSFLVAVKETTIPSCAASLERVASACIERRTLCVSGDPCEEVQRTLEKLSNISLTERGLHYNLSIEGTGISVIEQCNSSNPNVDVIAAPRSPIVLSGGRSQKYLVLSVSK